MTYTVMGVSGPGSGAELAECLTVRHSTDGGHITQPQESSDGAASPSFSSSFSTMDDLVMAYYCNERFGRGDV